MTSLSRPVPSFSINPVQTTKKSIFVGVPPTIKPNLANSQTRPKAGSNLALKTWRSNLFPASSPASKREVELLGEWLNSVLAENLEVNESPLDVCTNAQHWYSVAFNELLRQVSIDCAERGRLFAVIWKRNQDLLSKLVQIQRQERNYILDCHKERVQSLRADLDFTNSRLDTLQTAYAEELELWKQNNEKDKSKFDSLRSKIDEHDQSRKLLVEEIKDLRVKLGISDEPYPGFTDCIPPTVLQSEDLLQLCQKFRHDILKEDGITLEECNGIMNQIQDYMNVSLHSLAPCVSFREKYPLFFMSLPPDFEPEARDENWINAAITYVYANLIIRIDHTSFRDALKNGFIHFVYDLFLSTFGCKETAEKEFYVLLITVRELRDTFSRYTLFSRFLGLTDPLYMHNILFYIYVLIAMNREHPGVLFPGVESGDISSAVLPGPAIIEVAEKILVRFTEGRDKKFYSERVQRIVDDGYAAFNGRNVADLDSVLAYLTDVFIEESSKLEGEISQMFSQFPDNLCCTYTQFSSLVNSLKTGVPQSEIPCLILDGGLPISSDQFVDVIRLHGFFTPMPFDRTDFDMQICAEDITKFIRQELDIYTPMFTESAQRVDELGDEILSKQLKSSKTKLETSLNGKSISKTFNVTVQEFFERVYLASVSAV